MNAWWQTRTVRERRALLFGAGALALLALALLLDPITERRAWLGREVPRLAADLAWLRAHADEFTRLRAGAPATAPLTVADVEAALRRAALLDQVRELRAEARTNSVRFAFDNVPFAALLDLLHELRGRAQVVAARIEAMDGCPGFESGFAESPRESMGVPDSPDSVPDSPRQSPTPSQSMGVPNRDGDARDAKVNAKANAKVNSGCPQSGFVRGELGLAAFGMEGAGGR